MKNITLSADNRLIDEARKQAADQNTSLNNLFREWLKKYTQRQRRLAEFDRVMAKAPYFKSDRKYTREEMNQR